MTNRIIRIAALVAWGALVLPGCSVRLDSPLQDEAAIGFNAGSMLLREDDATVKGGVIKDGTEFSDQDNFFVYGSKTLPSKRSTVFRGDRVSVDGANNWDYTPHRFWDFNSSRYDFLAIAGPGDDSTISCDPSQDGALTAQVSYDPTVAQYDLMAACKRRLTATHSTDPVNLVFHHMLSAVSVVVINDSPSQLSITLNSYKFQNLCTQGTGTVTQDEDTPVFSGVWSQPAYNTNAVLGDAPACILAGGGTRSSGEVIDLMIPQEFGLSLTYIPRLVLDYSYRESEGAEPTRIVTGVRLEEIEAVNGSGYITKWLPGVRYLYEVHIRLGGGLRVSVSVAPWEEVHAETPGVTI